MANPSGIEDASEAPTLARRALGVALRADRLSAGLSTAAAARAAKVQPNTIWRIEQSKMGTRGPTVTSMCEAYGVSSERREFLLHLLERSGERGLWEDYSAVAPEWRLFYEAERASTSYDDWCPMLMPGLAQTQAYLAQLQELNPPASPEEAQVIRDGRPKRQVEVLRTPKGHRRFRFLIGGAAFQYLRHWPEAEAEQADRLEELAQRPDVQIRIAHRPHGCMHAAFTVITMGAPGALNPPLVTLEGLDAVRYIEQPDLVFLYQSTFDDAWAGATPYEEYDGG
ncbi:Scr1 family TA system antitoxin-like transcriptional regulator [Phytomonospora sp. NPDC050363]|uniref:Scr1 family TA system antitoxin-like transcriptional regulator n=1 Tax=Phytomonospora sp. NPDC050363 TaxID=3155642 RepID=UPI0033CFF60B